VSNEAQFNLQQVVERAATLVGDKNQLLAANEQLRNRIIEMNRRLVAKKNATDERIQEERNDHDRDLNNANQVISITLLLSLITTLLLSNTHSLISSYQALRAVASERALTAATATAATAAARDLATELKLTQKGASDDAVALQEVRSARLC
jgi:hypothetical protein